MNAHWSFCQKVFVSSVRFISFDLYVEWLTVYSQLVIKMSIFQHRLGIVSFGLCFYHCASFFVLWAVVSTPPGLSVQSLTCY